jgi:hypothetical protein
MVLICCLYQLQYIIHTIFNAFLKCGHKQPAKKIYVQGQKKARNPEESQANNHMRKRESCRGRDRTSTRRLAAAQRFSGQSWSA